MKKNETGHDNVGESTPLVQPKSEDKSVVLACLYGSHFLVCFGVRSWGFAVPLMLMSFVVDSLLPAAIFQICLTVACVVFNPILGKFLDSTSNRFRAASLCAASADLGVVACVVPLWYLMNEQERLSVAAGYEVPLDLSPSGNFLVFFSFVILLFLGSVEAVANLAIDVLLVRDWLVAIADGDRSLLSAANANMTRISLACEICAPPVVGVVLAVFPLSTSAFGMVVVIAYFALALVPKLWMLRVTTNRLQQKVVKPDASRREKLPATTKDTDVSVQQQEEQQQQHFVARTLSAMWEGWVLWAQQRVALASFAFLFVYLTVLAPGRLLSAYLVYSHQSTLTIAAFQSASAVSGVLSTFIFQRLLQARGPEVTGVVGVGLQLSMLIPATFIFLTDALPLPYFLLLIIFSRMGLWAFDLAEVQLMQEGVDPAVSGRVNSVERSLQQVASLISYAMAVVWSDPREFWVLVLISVVSVACSSLLFLTWIVKERMRGDGWRWDERY